MQQIFHCLLSFFKMYLKINVELKKKFKLNLITCTADLGKWWRKQFFSQILLSGWSYVQDIYYQYYSRRNNSLQHLSSTCFVSWIDFNFNIFTICRFGGADWLTFISFFFSSIAWFDIFVDCTQQGQSLVDVFYIYFFVFFFRTSSCTVRCLAFTRD